MLLRSDVCWESDRPAKGNDIGAGKERERAVREQGTKQTLMELLGLLGKYICPDINIVRPRKRRQVVQLLPANDGSLLRRSSSVISRGCSRVCC